MKYYNIEYRKLWEIKLRKITVSEDERNIKLERSRLEYKNILTNIENNKEVLRKKYNNIKNKNTNKKRKKQKLDSIKSILINLEKQYNKIKKYLKPVSDHSSIEYTPWEDVENSQKSLELQIQQYKLTNKRLKKNMRNYLRNKARKHGISYV